MYEPDNFFWTSGPLTGKSYLEEEEEDKEDEEEEEGEKEEEEEEEKVER